MLNLLLLLIVLCNFRLLAASRLGSAIHVCAIQGGLIAIVTAVLHQGDYNLLFIAGVLLTFGVKAVLFPWLLMRTLKKVGIRREVDPYVGYHLSLLAGLLMLVIGFWAGAHLPISGHALDYRLLIPTAVFGFLTGFFLISTRRKAITQVLGYLVLENGVYLFGMSVVEHFPVLVELGMLLDLLVAVFLMGIVVFRIAKTFEHINTSQMTALRE